MYSRIVETSDGSPTLAHGSFENEWMHNSQGAFSETLYVYGHAVKAVLESGLPFQFLSVGLGLGYLECLLAAMWRSNVMGSGAEWTYDGWVQSFEADPILVESFRAWILGYVSSETGVSGFIYEGIAAHFESHFVLPPGCIRGDLFRALQNDQLKLNGSLNTETHFTARASAVLFDAYSPASSPELWSDALLGHVLENACAPACYFATYASRVSVKKALRNSHFEVVARSGFGGKRECVFGMRKS